MKMNRCLFFSQTLILLHCERVPPVNGCHRCASIAFPCLWWVMSFVLVLSQPSNTTTASLYVCVTYSMRWLTMHMYVDRRHHGIRGMTGAVAPSSLSLVLARRWFSFFSSEPAQWPDPMTGLPTGDRFFEYRATHHRSVDGHLGVLPSD